MHLKFIKKNTFRDNAFTDFDIFLEIPLKIISRNYKYEVIPISWDGRKKGKSKFRIKELRSKYLFTLIYCFIEKNLLNLKK